MHWNATKIYISLVYSSIEKKRPSASIPMRKFGKGSLVECVVTATKTYRYV